MAYSTTKTLSSGVQRTSGLVLEGGVPREGVVALCPFPHTLPLCIFSAWLLLSCSFCNKPVIVSKGLSWVLWVHKLSNLRRGSISLCQISLLSCFDWLPQKREGVDINETSEILDFFPCGSSVKEPETEYVWKAAWSPTWTLESSRPGLELQLCYLLARGMWPSGTLPTLLNAEFLHL